MMWALALVLTAACSDKSDDDKSDDTGSAADANHAPGGVGIRLLPEAPRTGDNLLVEITDQAIDPDEGDAVTYRVAWRRNGELVEGLDQSWVGAEQTQSGETWEVELTPTDGRLDGEPARASVQVANTPPVVTVTISPEAPTTVDALVAEVDAEDADGDEVQLTWSWSRSGEVMAQDTEQVPSTETRVGDVWEVSVTPADGDEEGAPASASVVIRNSTPSVVAVELSPLEPREGDVIQATATTEDLDETEVMVTYGWKVNEALVQEGFGDTLDSALFAKGDAVRVEATPSDGMETGDSVESDSVTVRNTPPVFSSVRLDPEQVDEGGTVTCVAEGGEDADGDSISTSFSWTVNTTSVATTEQVDGTLFDRGDVLVCTATPNDGEESGAGVSSTPLTVSNSAPVVSSVTLSSTAPTEADTLTASVLASDPDDSDVLVVTTTWLVNGVVVAIANSIDGGDFDKGDLIQATAVASDGVVDSSAVASAFVQVVNTAPTITSVSLSPSQVFTDDTLALAYTGEDADGDTLGWSVAWFVDGFEEAGATGASLDGSTWFERGQEVWAVVTVSDGETTGASSQSPSVVVSNSPPGAPSVAITPPTPNESDDLVCEVLVDATDADTGDAVSYEYSWSRDGFDAGITSATVSASETSGGEVWTCAATATDGIDSGSPGVSGSVTVDQTPWLIYAQGDYAGACSGFDALLAADAADVDALRGKAWCTLKQLQGAAAVTAFQALLAVDSTVADGWVGLSAAFSLTGDHLDAADAAQSALDLDASYSSDHDGLDAEDVRVALARALVLGGDLIGSERALDELSTSHGLNMHDPESWAFGTESWDSYQVAALAYLQSYQESM